MKEALQKYALIAAKWIVVTVLWPLLEQVIATLLKMVVKVVIQGVKDLLEKWKARDTANATTDEERNAVAEKYDERVADVTQMGEDLLAASGTIATNVLAQSEGFRAKLLAKPPASFEVSAPAIAGPERPAT